MKMNDLRAILGFGPDDFESNIVSFRMDITPAHTYFYLKTDEQREFGGKKPLSRNFHYKTGEPQTLRAVQALIAAGVPQEFGYGQKPSED